MSEPLAVFQSAYANRKLEAYDAYDGTFLDVFITNSHPATVAAQPYCTVEDNTGELVAQLTYRMNTTDEQVMRDLLNSREEKREAQRQFFADWDVALEMNREFDDATEWLKRSRDLIPIIQEMLYRRYNTMGT